PDLISLLLLTTVHEPKLLMQHVDSCQKISPSPRNHLALICIVQKCRMLTSCYVPPASKGSRTFCYGNVPTRSLFLQTHFGPICDEKIFLTLCWPTKNETDDMVVSNVGQSNP